MYNMWNIVSRTNRPECIYRIRTYHIYIYINSSFYPQVWGSLRLTPMRSLPVPKQLVRQPSKGASKSREVGPDTTGNGGSRVASKLWQVGYQPIKVASKPCQVNPARWATKPWLWYTGWWPASCGNGPSAKQPQQVVHQPTKSGQQAIPVLH